jgi:outer membrane protein TolC
MRDAIAAALFLALAGCTVGPKYRQPASTQTPVSPGYKESPTQFKETEGWTVARPNDAMPRGKWWEIFMEPELNALEEHLNIDNQNIKQAFENFMVARALIREARAQYFPTLTTGPSYNRSRSSSNLAGASAASGSNGVATFTGQQSTIYTLPADISWAPDLWGRVRNTVREFQYGAQLSAADLENVRLTQQARLAQFYFEIRAQDALQKILNNTVEADKKSLELAKARYETGIDNALSVV